MPNIIGQDYSKRSDLLEKVDSHVLTEQDHVVRIPELLDLYQGHLDDLFRKFDNKLLYESALGGVFVDQLSESEVKAYREAEAKKLEAEAKAAEEARLFEEFKLHQSQSVNPSVSVQSPNSGTRVES